VAEEGRYPIAAVSKLTGLTPDTLRIWERRYGAVTPARDGRGRLYSGHEVRRLQLLASAVARGHAIGRIARSPDEDLQQLLSGVPAHGPGMAPTGRGASGGCLGLGALF
jgi:MerR family transcriptional regulator, light-induced transcriptional regulator